MSEESCEDVLKLKQKIMDEGLYEEGMSTGDMQQVYNTLNRSKRTANDDNEYRELMSQTDLNCVNVELLTPVELTNESDKNSDTEIVISKSNEKSTSNNENTKINRDKIDIVFNFNVTNSCVAAVMPLKQKENLIPILYHQEEFLKLHVETKKQVITSYLQHEKTKIVFHQTNFVDQWNKPIILNQKDEYIEPFGTGEEPEISCTNTAAENTSNSCRTLRSTRLAKRRNYTEIDSDEEFRTVVNKKPKSSNVSLDSVSEEFNEEPSTSAKSQKEDDEDYFPSTLSRRPKRNDSANTVTINKSTPPPKSIETTKQKWFSLLSSRERKYGKLSITPEVSDRTNKLFDKLKVDENKNKPTSPNMKLVLDNSDEDIFPIDKNVSNIHIEVTPKLKRGKSITNKKPQTKTRKKLNLKSTNELQTENNAIEVPTTNFYGKNKENELDASNNNKIIPSDMVQCPICSQSFPETEIEHHAARCELYDNSEEESLCTICNKYILNNEMNAHKFKCLKEITADSIEKSCDKNNKPLSGFLCNVCDMYVTEGSVLDHANSCIATVAD